MRKFTTYLPDPVAERVLEKAKRDGLSQSGAIRNLLISLFQSPPSTARPNPRSLPGNGPGKGDHPGSAGSGEGKQLKLREATGEVKKMKEIKKMNVRINKQLEKNKVFQKNRERRQEKR